jgi:Ca2+-binding RTX toxin-like protein
MVQSFNVAAAKPSEVRLSPDGSRLYSAGTDGILRVYSVKTGALIDSWQVGTKLGGMDISADGSFLMVVERQPLSTTGDQWSRQTLVTIYKVDTATGQSTSFPFQATGYDHTFFDVAILSNGKVLISQDFSGSGWVRLKLLDPATGQYAIGPDSNQSSVFSLSATRERVLIGEPNSSGGPLAMYQAGSGIVARASASGYNWGIQAFNGTLAANYIYNQGINIYNSALQLQTTLVSTPDWDWRSGRVGDLLFDPTGQFLYVLDNVANAIVQLRTADWTVVDSIPVNATVGYWAGQVGSSFGNRLMLDPQGRYFSVVTQSGLVLVANPDAPAMNGTGAADTMEGTPFADVINGGDGPDSIDGGGGDDILNGNGGDDVIDGGADNDVLNGGAGTDELRGGAGDDVVYDSEGLDTLGYSLLDGGDGFDWVELYVPNYTGVLTIDLQDASGPVRNFERSSIQGGSGIFTFLGSAGIDIVFGGASADRLEGRDGDDDLRGFAGNDVLIGGAGNDLLIGGTGADEIYGGEGNDNLHGGTEGSYLDGGAGDDNMSGGAGADTLVGGGGSDYLLGFGGDDTLEGGDGADRLDGGAGTDTMRGGAGDDIYFVDSAADVIEENAGEGTDVVRTALGVYSLADRANVENLTATSNAPHDFRGNGGDNLIAGGDGNDNLRLQDGGNDIVLGFGGNDNIFMIGSLTGADIVNGGAGTDTLVLQGNYAGGITLTANVTNIELISILAGSNTSFGESGAGRYDYVLTTHDANFSGAIQVRINGSALLEGEDFTFDGSAELDSRFVVYGGRGKDSLTGSQNADIFFFAEERFSTGDTVNGGAGYDGMFLRGNYTIDFNAPGYTGLFTNIENLTLTSATDERYARGGGTEFDYNLVLSNAIVKPGETLTVSGALLMASETMMVDAGAETDGFLSLFGGKASDTLKGGALADLIHGNLGADQLTGNGGADTFRYQGVGESTASSLDHILDFEAGVDKIDLSRMDADTNSAGNQAFSWIGSNAFSGSAGQLRAYQDGASWFVEGDTNGDGVADLVIQLTVTGGPLTQGDFLP